MTSRLHVGNRWLAPTLLIVSVFALAALTLRQPSASAGNPPPDVPDLEGEPFSATVNGLGLPEAPLEPYVPQQQWQEIFFEDFESVNWELRWTNISLNGAPYKYGTRDIPNDFDPASDAVAWAVGGGPSGSTLDPDEDSYPPNVDSWLVTPVFNFEGVVDARLVLDSFYQANAGDTFAVAVSTDGVNFVGVQITDGGSGSWSQSGLPLVNYAGEPAVRIAFIFKSNSNAVQGHQLGLLLDNISVSVRQSSRALIPFVSHGPTPTAQPTETPTPTPTATPIPQGGDYRDNFTDTIVPWNARRWTLGTAFNLIHRSDCEENRCGFLELTVNSSSSYVIASPLIQSRPYPYNIELKAKQKDKEDGHSYGIIFGGNWNGQACPEPNFNSCFTQYYELRVEFKEDGADRYLRYKLKRVDGHDSNNQNIGPDLIDWTRVNANPDTFVEWDVNVSQSGTIRISANNNPVGSANDTTYLNNRYFGFIGRTSGNRDSRVKVDYYKIDWPTIFYELYP
jgi:hypothetical protein